MNPGWAWWLVTMAGPLAVAGASAAYWAVVLYRVAVTVAQLPTARAGVALAAGAGAASRRPVLVVVPAHNERGAIVPLIESLRAQDHPAVRVVLALDRCTDGTEEAARGAIGEDPRFEVVRVDSCPSGWAGKVHAIHRGLEAAGRRVDDRDAELLLFTDADCVFEPAAIRAAAALMADRGLHLLSLLNTLRSGRWFERVAQPVAGFELMRQYPLLRVNRGGERQRAFANGQFMLFDAAAYDAIGGHAAVRDELLEDIALARSIKSAGLRGGLLASGGMVRCAMYDSWAQFTKGWKRIYTESANRRSGRLIESALRALVGVGLMPVTLAAVAVAGLWAPGAWGVAGVVIGAGGLLCAMAALGLVYVQSRAPLWAVTLAPIGGLLVAWILLEAATDLRRGRPTEWGGRAYHRVDRSRAEARPSHNPSHSHSTGGNTGAGPSADHKGAA